jgi:hypothetical protein
VLLHVGSFFVSHFPFLISFRAQVDQKRYNEQMANYHPPDREQTKKRAKTGYNMFFSAYVVQLRQSAAGVPPERGSVARLVGTAWKVRRCNSTNNICKKAPRLCSDVPFSPLGHTGTYV